MHRDARRFDTDDYSDMDYWDSRYIQEPECFDWYQHYSSLRPLIRFYLPSFSSSVLNVGCGNAVLAEQMVKDGYKDIMNIDFSEVAIEMMRRRHEKIPQLKYKQLDVRGMACFQDESFDGVIDKGTMDSLMCGSDALISVTQMLGEVNRLLKPGGIYVLVTYANPKLRMPHLNRAVYNWEIVLFVTPRSGSQTVESDLHLTPVPLNEKGMLPDDFVLEDPHSHYIYVCKRNDPTTNVCSMMKHIAISD